MDCELWLKSCGSLSPEDQQYGAWLRGEPERVGAWSCSESVRFGKQSTKQADKSGASRHGGEERSPRRSSGKKEKTGPKPPKESISIPKYFGSQIPKSQECEKSTFFEQLPVVDLHTQGKMSMDLGPNKAGGPPLEGLSESTRKGLNEQIEVDPTTSNFPKMWTRSTGSTWK